MQVTLTLHINDAIIKDNPGAAIADVLTKLADAVRRNVLSVEDCPISCPAMFNDEECGRMEVTEGAHYLAQRKAKYGHRPWIVWTDRSGKMHATKAHAEHLRAAIDSVGRKGKFTGYCSDGQGVILNHQTAKAWLANAEAGQLV